MGAVTGLSPGSDQNAGTIVGSTITGVPGGVFKQAAGQVSGTGSIGEALGVKGGGNPELAQLQQGVTPEQIAESYKGSQNALESQQNLLNALQGQNGIGNQSAAFNQSQTLANQLAGANAVQNQSSALQAQRDLAGQQAATAGQYQNIANGTGPNPARAMLNQTTGQNVANQAALMAGQRGAGANAGLLARQAAQQGAGIQQQAVGQGATMQAQQQIAGLQGLSAQQAAIGNTNQNVAGIAGQQLAAQQATQQAMANQAQQQVANQMGASQTLNQAQQSQQQNLLSGLNAQNQAAVSNQASVNAANAGLANTAMQGRQGLAGGVLNGAGAIFGLAQGGMVHHMADGGATEVAPPTPALMPMTAPVAAAPAQPIAGPQSSFGKFLSGFKSGPAASPDQGSFSGVGGANSGAQALNQGATNFGKGIKKGMGKSGAASAAGGESLAGPDMGAAATMVAAKGGLAEKGGHVAAKKESQKAVKKGNSYDNDKVPAMLSEGEIVIPRAVLQSSDPVRGAAEFVAKIMSKRRS